MTQHPEFCLCNMCCGTPNSNKPSELFEGENSSLRKTFDNSTQNPQEKECCDKCNSEILAKLAKRNSVCEDFLCPCHQEKECKHRIIIHDKCAECGNHHPQQSEWEERFNIFMGTPTFPENKVLHENLKSFIQLEINRAREEEREAIMRRKILTILKKEEDNKK